MYHRERKEKNVAAIIYWLLCVETRLDFKPQNGLERCKYNIENDGQIWAALFAISRAAAAISTYTYPDQELCVDERARGALYISCQMVPEANSRAFNCTRMTHLLAIIFVSPWAVFAINARVIIIRELHVNPSRKYTLICKNKIPMTGLCGKVHWERARAHTHPTASFIQDSGTWCRRKLLHFTLNIFYMQYMKTILCIICTSPQKYKSFYFTFN